MTLASAGISCDRRVSVRRSQVDVYTETAKRRITRTVPHDSAGTLVFWCRKFRRNSNGVTQTGRHRQMQVGYVKCSRGIAENWRLTTRSVVNLARLQVYHHTFAVLQCVAGLSVTANPCLLYFAVTAKARDCPDSDSGSIWNLYKLVTSTEQQKFIPGWKTTGIAKRKINWTRYRL